MMEYVEVQFDRVLSSNLLSLLAFKYDTTNIFMCSHPSSQTTQNPLNENPLNLDPLIKGKTL